MARRPHLGQGELKRQAAGGDKRHPEYAKMNCADAQIMKHSITNRFHPMRNIRLLLSIAFLWLALAAHAAPTPSVLQFRLVVDNPTPETEQMAVVQPKSSSRPPEIVNVQKEVLLDQSDVKSATFGTEISGIPANVPEPMKILIKFTDEGAEQLAEVTRQNIGKRLAIVIDGKLYSTPQIATAITGGNAEIAGNFTKEEATVLATKLNGSPAHEVLTWHQIGIYCFAVLFTAAMGIIVWIAIRRKDTSSAAS
jgi:hypothetical protein